MTGTIILLIVIAIPLAVGIYVWVTYNRLVSLRNRIAEAWSDIQVQMKRRYDLVPNLVETVKGYATQERDVFEAVVKARAAAISNQGSAADQAKSENMLSGALKSLFAVAEAYPELKSNENFLQMQRDLAEIEDHIQRSRRFYNGSAREMNDAIQQFPSNLVANAFKFTAATYFELDADEAAAARKPVAVDFKR
ncbi:MAG: LemA family protein [Dongiaceae bacterium]